jgi:hypothetical protein
VCPSSGGDRRALQNRLCRDTVRSAGLALALHGALAKSAAVLARGDMRHRRRRGGCMLQCREELARELVPHGRAGEQHG